MARIIVIGGGTAGTAAALALHKAGFDVTVHEAHHDSAEDIGAFLTLATNGLRALAQFDAVSAVASVGFPLTTLRVLDGTGTELARRPLAGVQDPLLPYRCLRRGELNAALQAEAARRGIDVRHGARLASVEDGPDDVTVRFTDGSTATGDLLIGADGLNSTVRRTIAPAVHARYSGEHVLYGYTTEAPVAGPTDLFTLIRGSAAAFGYAVSPAGETYWFARVSGDPLSAEKLANGTPARWRDLLLPLLRKDATPAADMVAATTDSILVTNATEMPPATPWRAGRALLIGDAAHAASPATGQGASMALEDAVVLAKALRDAPDTESALTAYETLRRPRVEHNIITSGRISRRAHSPATVRPGSLGTPGTTAAPVSDDGLVRQLDWDTNLWTMVTDSGPAGDRG
ncbi:FAD-dependent oxidoreductase [Streptomyces acidicola]|uniref:FAD-dependent oxidoreductase n=1 Tax=Streptomyces acidicola TaxID=2596892 RepID=UPI00341243D0